MLGQICRQCLVSIPQKKFPIVSLGLPLLNPPPTHLYVFPMESSGLRTTYCSCAQYLVIRFVSHAPLPVFHNPSQLKTTFQISKLKRPHQEQSLRPSLSFINHLHLLLGHSTLDILSLLY